MLNLDMEVLFGPVLFQVNSIFTVSVIRKQQQQQNLWLLDYNCKSHGSLEKQN